MILKTGFGVFIDAAGKKIRKFELPVGEHADRPGFTVMEVSSKDELDNVVLEKSDKEIARDIEHHRKKVLRNSGIRKLQEISGLTEEEIHAMIGG